MRRMGIAGAVAVVAVLALSAPAFAQRPGSAYGRVDPGRVANWLPYADPWARYDALPALALCRFRVTDGRIGGAWREAWPDDRAYDGARARDRRYDRRDGRYDGRYDSDLRGVDVAGRCVPYPDYLALYRPWLASYTLEDVAELERARARLQRDAYPLGPYGEDARFGDPYSGRPDPYPEEHRLRERTGAPTGAEDPVARRALEQPACARVSVRTARGVDLRVRLGLPALGADSPESLADAIEREHAAGRAINIAGLDAVALRLAADDAITRLVVASCQP